jgi:Oxysterol-binding protein
MNSNMKTNFWGKSLEVKPLGLQHVRLVLGQNPDGTKITEHYTIERVNSTVNNLIFGEMYVEHVGTMTVRNVTNGNVCLVEFKKRGWTGKGAYEIEGHAYESGNTKDKKARLFGKWIESMSINYQDREEVIWVANPLPPESPSMYYFTYFTLQLNFMPPSLKNNLPPTDSRFRPDQRALENGDLVKAAEEKVRLEEKQRKMRKDRESRG